jgi:hypothetical protein
MGRGGEGENKRNVFDGLYFVTRPSDIKKSHISTKSVVTIF